VQGPLQLLSALYATRFVRPSESARVCGREGSSARHLSDRLMPRQLRNRFAIVIPRLEQNSNPPNAGVRVLPLRVPRSLRPWPRLSASLESSFVGFLRSSNFVALNDNWRISKGRKKGIDLIRSDYFRDTRALLPKRFPLA
jgi:hypothetical protein